ncbi:MAG: M12 family metallo-peptidase [archaeon]
MKKRLKKRNKINSKRKKIKIYVYLFLLVLGLVIIIFFFSNEHLFKNFMSSPMIERVNRIRNNAEIIPEPISEVQREFATYGRTKFSNLDKLKIGEELHFSLDKIEYRVVVKSIKEVYGDKHYVYAETEEGSGSVEVLYNDELFDGMISTNGNSYDLHSVNYGEDKNLGIPYVKSEQNYNLDDMILPEDIEGTSTDLEDYKNIYSSPPGDFSLDETAYFDVMFVYTKQARNSIGGEEAMNNKIQLQIERMSNIISRSQINAEARLVHSYMTDHERFLKNEICDEYIHCSISRLRNLAVAEGDGILDEIHEKRTIYGADAVVVIYEQSGMGYAFLLNPHLPESQRSAFAFLGDSGLRSRMVTHELGHTLGCAHNRNVDNYYPPAYPFAWGYKFYGKKTMMGVGVGDEIPNYANPDVYYGGYPTGIAYDPDATYDNSADCSENIELVRYDYADFRGCRVNCKMDFVTDVNAVLESDGTIKVTFSKSDEPGTVNHLIYRDKHCLAKPVFTVGQDAQEFIDDNYISDGEEYCYSISYETDEGKKGPCSEYKCVQVPENYNPNVEWPSSETYPNVVERWTYNELGKPISESNKPEVVLGNSNKLFYYSPFREKLWGHDDYVEKAILLKADEDFNEPLKNWEIDKLVNYSGAILMSDISAAKNSEVYAYSMKRSRDSFGTIRVFDDSGLLWEYTEDNMQTSTYSQIDKFLVDISDDGRYIAAAYDTSDVDGNGYLLIFDTQNTNPADPQPDFRKSLSSDFGFDKHCLYTYCFDDNLVDMDISGDGSKVILAFDFGIGFDNLEVLIYDVPSQNSTARETLENDFGSKDDFVLDISGDGSRIAGCNENKLFFMDSDYNDYEAQQINMQNEIGGYTECFGVKISNDSSTLAYSGKETVGSVSVKNLGVVDLSSKQLLLTDSIEFKEESTANEPHEFVAIDMTSDGNIIAFGSDGDEAKKMPEVLVYDLDNPDEPIFFKKFNVFLSDPEYRTRAIPLISSSDDKLFIYSAWNRGDNTYYKEIFSYDLVYGIRITSAPMDVVASEDGYEDGVNVAWKKSDFNDDGYKIYRTTDPNKPGCDSSSDVIANLGSDKREYRDTTVETGITYYYSVWADNDNGGGCSLINSGILKTNRNAARNVIASDGEYFGYVMITWDKSFYGNEESYEIFRGDSPLYPTVYGPCAGISLARISAGDDFSQELSFMDDSSNGYAVWDYSVKTYVPGEGTFCSKIDTGFWDFYDYS